jgi:transcriptional regulator with XRE-family HTH domain
VTALPFGPLAAILADAESMSLEALARRCGVSARTVRRWHSAGIDVFAADAVAARAGMHPWEVWGDLFHDTPASHGPGRPGIDIDPGRLVDERGRAGLSCRALAAAAGLSGTTVSRIERGLRRPGPAALDRIAAVLALTVDELMSAR